MLLYNSEKNATRRIPGARWKLRQEKRMIKKVHRIFRKQMNWVVENLAQLSFIQNNSIDDEIERFMEELPYREELADEIIVFIRLALREGGEGIIKELRMDRRFGVRFDLKSQAVRDILNSREAFELSNAHGTITATTQRGIKEVLLKTYEAGLGYSETAALIRKQAAAGVFSQKRAELIAVREIGKAFEDGKDVSIKDFKSRFPERMVWKFWQTVEDSRVTKTHRANQNDGWIIDEEYFSGTGDAHAPGSDNPRCRCFTKRYISSEKGEKPT